MFGRGEKATMEEENEIGEVFLGSADQHPTLPSIRKTPEEL